MEQTLTLSARRRFPRAAALAALVPALLMLAGCGGSSSSTPPANLLGTWGGGTSESPAVLTLTPTGGTLAFDCGAADTLTQPLVAGTNGSFDVVATVNPGLPAGPLPPIHLVGTVSGNTITLHEVTASGPRANLMVTYGKSAPAFNGACPG